MFPFLIPLVQDYLTDHEALCLFRPTCKYINTFQYKVKRSVGQFFKWKLVQEYGYKNVIITDFKASHQLLPHLELKHLVKLTLLMNESCTIDLGDATSIKELRFLTLTKTPIEITFVRLPPNLIQFRQLFTECMDYHSVSVYEFPNQLQDLQIKSHILRLGELPDTLIELSLSNIYYHKLRLGNSLRCFSCGGSLAELPDLPESLVYLNLRHLKYYGRIHTLPKSLVGLYLPFLLQLHQIDMELYTKNG